MKSILSIVVGLICVSVQAQQMLSLEEAYKLAEENYPLGKQLELFVDKTSNEIEILEKEKLPKLYLRAQATYQSDVLGLSSQLPNLNFDAPNKDQYRATLEVDQLIYDGGTIGANSKLKQAELEVDKQQVIVDLYQLKYRVNQYYFSALLLQQQQEVLNSKKRILIDKLQEIDSGVKHGAVLKANAQVLNAEILKLDQQLIQLDYDLKKAYEKLSLLIRIKIDDDTILSEPKLWYELNGDNKRPELALYDLKEKQLEASKEVLSKSLYPKISGFAQAGYGNPGLNMLDNSFKDFYMVGLKFSWNLFDWGTTDKKKSSVDINKQIIKTQKESFLLNNEIEQKEAENEILKYEEIIGVDEGIIKLREEVLKTTESQLKYGVITSSDFVTELDKLFQAKMDQQLHITQLKLSIANYQIILGD